MPEEKPCGLDATFRYTWPGRDEAVVCVVCAAKLKAVADAIGLHLQLIPLTDFGPDGNWPTCPQMKKVQA